MSSTSALEHASTPESVPAPSKAPQRLGLALTVISAAQLMVVLDGTIVNIALPHLQKDLGFTPDNLSWVVNAYTLAFGGLLLLGGRLGDLFGRRKVFMTGVIVFALASLLGGIAQTEAILLGARALQGVGAALASPTALALITTTFPAGQARNRAMGVYAAMSGAGAAIGLILGGALTEASWRWTFFINVPIGLLVVFLAPRVLKESERGRGTLDVPGAVTGTLGLASLVYGLTHAASTSWSDAVTVGTLIAGVVLLGVFMLVESRSEHPLLPVRILQDRTRGTSFVVMLVVGAAMFSMFYFLGLYIQQVLGYSPLKAGFAFLPFSFGIVIAAQVASALMTRVDPRWISGTGAVLASAAMFGFSRLQVDSSYAGHLLPFIVVMAFGMGLVFVPMTLTAVAGVAQEDSGVASAVLNTMQQVGGSLGLATLSTVFASALADRAGELGGALQAKAAAGGMTPEQIGQAKALIGLQAQTYGSGRAYLVGASMILVAAAITFAFLNVKHAKLSTEGHENVHLA
ncbi:MFS transporter [Phycicoccus sp. Soil748]|uniref:MFS transporter n=1 Tax=Phycicoccus sp. Soil748 TaxID=1736397 RepID=UPI0007037203|nr:MFS transporter [Phycicoccus sp. Soil748]KRE55363.1 MFS transporter [Phycicoccus sp. Soil748]